MNLGLYYECSMGQDKRALELYQQGMAICKEIRDQAGLGCCLARSKAKSALLSSAASLSASLPEARNLHCPQTGFLPLQGSEGVRHNPIHGTHRTGNLMAKTRGFPGQNTSQP